MKRKAAIVLILFTGLFAGFAQGFINLNFESAKNIPIVGSPFYPYMVAATNALPGWTVYAGLFGTLEQQSQITVNDPTTGGTWVSLWATNGSQLSGKYSVFLQGGQSAPYAAISQTGLVPASANTLEFEAQGGQPGTLQVTLGGQYLSLIVLSNASNYTVYGADISAFANQTEPLTFISLPQGGSDGWTIDNIQFSVVAVPEPSTLALLATDCLLFFRCRRKVRLPNAA
jgi:PEP-CTERM motif